MTSLINRSLADDGGDGSRSFAHAFRQAFYVYEFFFSYAALDRLKLGREGGGRQTQFAL